MASEKVETVVAGNYIEMEPEEGDSKSTKSKLSNLFWHGGSVYDAWFSCASNQAQYHAQHHWLFLVINEYLRWPLKSFYLCIMQVAQVLLTLPYSFSQLGMLSGILFQLFYGLMGSWTAYLISVLYVEYRTRKEREKVDFRNHVIQVISINQIFVIKLCFLFHSHIVWMHSLLNISHFRKGNLISYYMAWSTCSGLKCLMDCWGSTGGT